MTILNGMAQVVVQFTISQRAEEHPKLDHHFTIKSIAKLPWNPQISKTVLKAYFQHLMTVFSDCLIYLRQC